MIPYGRQSISDDDIAAVEAVLRSDFLTQGPTVPRFEKAIADYCGVPHAVAVNSATSALHIACMAAGLGPGDFLWTSPNTFVASANCARYCGAEVDFVDIDPRTYNLCPQRLAEKLAVAERAGKLPKVVIPVHFAGQSCDMAAIGALAEKYGFTVIEDASHAIGAEYLDTPIGSCTYSSMCIFSFHPVKIITTAEGGLITTNDSNVAEKLRLARTHGVTRDPILMMCRSEGPWWYEQITLGYNYRMTDVLAVLGISQLSRLNDFVSKRRAIASFYSHELAGLPVTLPWQAPHQVSAWHLYVVQVDAAFRASLFEQLRNDGIGVNVHYIPVHLQPYYQRLGFKTGDFPVVEAYYASCLSLPIFSDLAVDQMDHVVCALRQALLASDSRRRI